MSCSWYRKMSTGWYDIVYLKMNKDCIHVKNEVGAVFS